MHLRTRSVLAAVALAVVAPPALAHGGLPRAMSISFDPVDPDRVVIAGLNWGFFVSHDGGASWTLNCYEAQGSGHDSNYAPPILIGNSGAIFAPALFSSWESTDSLCHFERPELDPALLEPYLVGVKRAADGSLFALANLVDDAANSKLQLFRSLDVVGASFGQIGVTLEGHFAFESFVTDPSSAETVHAIATDLEKLNDGTLEFRLFTTTDGAQTWSSVTLFAATQGVPTQKRELLAVDPNHPELLFLKSSTSSADLRFGERQDTILFSTNRGLDWHVLYTGVSTVQGFAYSPDHRQVAIGDSRGGLFTVEAAALLTSTHPLTKVSDEEVWAITWNESGLYAGLDEFQVAGKPRRTVGVSHDGGHTFVPFLTVCSVMPAECSTPAPEATSCFDAFHEQLQGLPCEPQSSGGGGGGSGGGSSAAGGGGSGGAPSTGGGTAGTNDDTSGAGAGGTTNEDLRITSCTILRPGRSNSQGPTDAGWLALAFGAAGAVRLGRSGRRNKHPLIP